ncbi:hypothetical protein JG687_00017546 [Phytophthora cactorum]|uniref:Uncharacterized protein n=1 Tax=Phytophthora cactorum TaxID=29920 RepID=A0A329RX23_9STRA|nr:hypothetical protein Pcac1_g14462 [Phytophthora cactorum]KAG2800877.1 hypothetical protein PC112_g20281 [Phytophthora cactorum]KAG2801271.1 hypothetical protein PC111_g19613 [Phytophthora cactorum]KAG2854464.1 hypothetical protein PC113_g13294 [Phytophthora cactorum]KAG2891615.1 hypothetical protein PC114_g16949 [Phytophthora cactorum]
MEPNAPSPTTETKKLGFESGKALMAEDLQVLREYMASKFCAAMGRAMPQMDVRFSNLSVTADIVVVDDPGAKHELLTIPNTM